MRILNILTSGEPCQAMTKAMAVYAAGKAGKARHDAMLAPVLKVVRLSEQGHDGGQVIFEGPPADLARADASLTGQFLRGRIGIPQA